eukprot:g285.t1
MRHGNGGRLCSFPKIETVQTFRRKTCTEISISPDVENDENYRGWTIRKFQSAGGSFVVEDLAAYVKQWCKSNPLGTIHVGCDSKERKNQIIYATAVVMRIPRQGGHIVFSKRQQPKNAQFSNTFERLNAEVRQAVHTAQALLSVVDPSRVEVHVDLSSSHEHLSHRLHAMATGWIAGVGLTPAAKPEAWAASAVAHRFCQKW